MHCYSNSYKQRQYFESSSSDSQGDRNNGIKEPNSALQRSTEAMLMRGRGSNRAIMHNMDS